MMFFFCCLKHRFEADNSLMSVDDKNVLLITNATQEGGWDYSYLAGNFLIVDLDFWFSPIVSLHQKNVAQ